MGGGEQKKERKMEGGRRERSKERRKDWKDDAEDVMLKAWG